MSIRINTIVDFLNINNLRPDHFKLASGAPAQGQLLSGSCRFAKSSQRWFSNVDSDWLLILLWLWLRFDSFQLSWPDFGWLWGINASVHAQKVHTKDPQGIFFETRCGATTLAAARAAPPLPCVTLWPSLIHANNDDMQNHVKNGIPMYTPTTTVNIDIPYAYLDCQCHQLSPTVVYCHLLSSAVIVI